MKKCLKDNKIYFEIIAPILFGLAALFISIASCNISKQQLLISEIELQPHFYLEEDYIFNPKKEIYDETEMIIYNGGSPASNISISLVSYIKVGYEKNKQFKKSLVPITGYYSSQFSTYSPKGKVATLKDYLNNEKFFEICNQFFGPAKEKYGLVDINLIHVTKINYQDRNNKNGNKYFIGTEIVPADKGKPLVDSYYKSSPIQLSELNADILMEQAYKFEKTP